MPRQPKTEHKEATRLAIVILAVVVLYFHPNTTSGAEPAQPARDQQNTTLEKARQRARSGEAQA